MIVSPHNAAMKKILAALAFSMLAACAQTAVSQLGPNRYRVTTDNQWSTTGAESDALQQAQTYCAAQGRIADARITASRPYMSYVSYASASAEFTCVPR